MIPFFPRKLCVWLRKKTFGYLRQIVKLEEIVKMQGERSAFIKNFWSVQTLQALTKDETTTNSYHLSIEIGIGRAVTN